MHKRFFSLAFVLALCTIPLVTAAQATADTNGSTIISKLEELLASLTTELNQLAAGQLITGSSQTAAVGAITTMSIRADQTSITVGQSTMIRASFSLRFQETPGDSVTSNEMTEITDDGTHSVVAYSGATWGTSVSNPLTYAFTPAAAGAYVFRSFVTSSKYPAWIEIPSSKWAILTVIATKPVATPMPLIASIPSGSSCPSSGDQAAIQNALSGVGAKAVLCPNAVFNITAPIRFTADNQEISTLGYPTDGTRAIIRVTGGNGQAIVGYNSGIALRNIIIDGNRPALGYLAGDNALIDIGGSGGSASGQIVDHIKAYVTHKGGRYCISAKET